MNDDEFNEPLDTPVSRDGLVTPATRDKEPPHPDTVRQFLAYSLVALLALMVLGALCSYIAGWLNVDELKELSILITPILTLTGTAIGFYFGSSGPK